MKTDTQFYEQLLGFDSKWAVTEVKIDKPKEEIHIYLNYNGKEWIDKETGEIFPIYDLRPERVWRHLDTLQYKTYLYAQVPRIKTQEGKVVSIKVPWADKEVRHSHMFENRCIEILQATHNQSQTGELMNVSQERVNDIMLRGVERGLDRRKIKDGEITQICIDEKSYGAGHKYVSVLSDPKNGRVLDIVKDRDISATETILNKIFDKEGLNNIKAVCCDMWEAYQMGLKKIVRMLYLSMTNSMLLSI